ncbi:MULTISPECIES: hypothetical protein [Geobacillus]|uniref:hypothetical protein n=1 Tax=Geobacillus TaxID=129337 RepID=UPI000B1129AE|nr:MULTISPECIES: hypothetical protein [Geobacillus]
MADQKNERFSLVHEEMAFEWGDFAVHQPFWLIEEQKQAKEKETKQKKLPR